MHDLLDARFGGRLRRSHRVDVEFFWWLAGGDAVNEIVGHADLGLIEASAVVPRRVPARTAHSPRVILNKTDNGRRHVSFISAEANAWACATSDDLAGNFLGASIREYLRPRATSFTGPPWPKARISRQARRRNRGARSPCVEARARVCAAVSPGWGAVLYRGPGSSQSCR